MSVDPEKRAALALVVGVGQYRLSRSIPSLPCAVADAEWVAKTLLDQEICAFPEEGVKLLTDAGATRVEVVRRLSKWLPEAGRGAEIVLIYFAGHGMMLGEGRESAFLLPHDADPEDLVTLGIEMGDLRRWIGAIDAAAVVLCLDCCHSGKVIARHVEPDRPTIRDIGITPSAFQGLTAKDPKGKGLFVIAACDDGQRSHEVKDLGHGLFTHHLLRGIAGEADRDGDGRVGIAELFEHVSEAVESDADRKFGLRQKPWYSATGSGRVYISRKKESRDSTPSLFEARRPSADRSEEERIAEFERWFEVADPSELIRGLRHMKSMSAPSRFPSLFRCLAHPSEEVRERAMGAIDAIGWPETARAIQAQARRLDDDRAGHVLDGLRAIRSHPELVELLDHLVETLKGAPRNRAILLVEQKRLVLELDAIAGLFRERRSPYRIDRVLGQGLFTAAYLAHDERHDDMEVVVRILRREFVHQPMVRAHFLGLSRRCVPLTHQNLVSTRDAGDFRDRHVFFSIRQYVDGVTLQAMLEAGRSFSTAEVVALLRQAADALIPLHEAGIVHGGIKPSNLFVTRKDRVILGDPSMMIPGIAVSFDRLSYDYRYASPEQFEGGGQLAPQSDFYALGCVAYELLCGAPPHVADNHYDLVVKHKQGAIEPPAGRGSSAGPAGDALVRRLLSRAPAGRPADAEALVREIDDLREALRGAGGTPRLAPSLLGGALDRYRGVQSLVDLGPGVPGPESSDEDVSEWDIKPGRSAPTPPGPGSLGLEDVSPDDPFDSDLPASDTPIPAPETAWPVATPEALEPSSAGVFPTNEGPFDTTDAPGGEIPASADRGGNPAPAEEGFDLDEVRGELLVKGRVLFNKYILQEKLGAGGMGEVWRVQHISLDSDRALKFLRTGLAPSSQLRERFRREAKVMARLSHPNAVEIHDAFTARGMAFIEMAYVPGRSLAQILKPGKPMPLDWTVRVLQQLCDVLTAAHEAGIVHRDLKPANLMLLKHPPQGREFLKVLDFGIAKLLDLERDEVLGGERTAITNDAPIGTYPYMSPEQFGAAPIDTRSDIYAVGVILFEVLTGRRPFEAPNQPFQWMHKHVNDPIPSFHDRNPDAIVPPEVERVVRRCLAKSPDDRPQSALALLEEFEGATGFAWLDNASSPSTHAHATPAFHTLPGPAPVEERGSPTGHDPGPRSPTRSYRRIGIVLALAAALGTAIALIGYWLGDR